MVRDVYWMRGARPVGVSEEGRDCAALLPGCGWRVSGVGGPLGGAGLLMTEGGGLGGGSGGSLAAATGVELVGGEDAVDGGMQFDGHGALLLCHGLIPLMVRCCFVNAKRPQRVAAAERSVADSV